MLEHVNDTILLVSAVASGSLLNAVAQGLCLTAAVGLCLRLFPGIKPSARFVIWLAVLFTVLCLNLQPIFAGPTDPALATSVPSFHLDPRWSIPVVIGWLIISVTRAVALFRSALELRRIAREASPNAFCTQFQHLLKIRFRSAQLCISTQIDRPSVAGFFHPRILLPEDLLQRLSSQELEHILLHEMEHLRRFDDWTNLLQKIVLVLFPLNPILLWVERRLCRERELACDDCVLNFTAARKTYATCLTSLAEHSLLRRRLTLALGAWDKQSELSRRIHRILGKPEVRMKPLAANVVTGIVIVGLAGAAAILGHSPTLVSFTPLPAATSMSQLTVATSARAHDLATSSPHIPHTLVKEVVPDERENAKTHRATTGPRPQTLKTIHREPRPQIQQWVMLTRWQESRVPQRPILAVSETTGSSYAAVPVGNVWLIVQL